MGQLTYSGNEALLLMTYQPNESIYYKTIAHKSRVFDLLPDLAAGCASVSTTTLLAELQKVQAKDPIPNEASCLIIRIPPGRKC